MQVCDGALRVRGGLEDRPLVRTEYGQPARKVCRMVRPRLELGHDAEIRAQQRRANFGDIS